MSSSVKPTTHPKTNESSTMQRVSRGCCPICKTDVFNDQMRAKQRAMDGFYYYYHMNNKYNHQNPAIKGPISCHEYSNIEYIRQYEQLKHTYGETIDY